MATAECNGMELIATSIADVKVLVPRKFGDSRGFFAETYHRGKYTELGIDVEFVQDNHSLSAGRGVVRGLHFQIPPMAQAKLIRVIKGAILDVAVDIRRSSPTFGQHVVVELSEANLRQVYIPPGFAHGFVTLADATEVCYKVSNFYSPEHERGIFWNDPELAIDWGVAPEAATLSEKDTKYGRLAELQTYFE